jgi:hypothetical protein
MTTYELPGRRVATKKMRQRRSQAKHLQRRRDAGHPKSPAPRRPVLFVKEERKETLFTAAMPKSPQTPAAAPTEHVNTRTIGTTVARPAVDTVHSTASLDVDVLVATIEESATAEGVTAAIKRSVEADLALPIEELGLDIRPYNTLKREGINSIGELVNRTEGDLLDIRNLGAKYIDQIKVKLDGMGLALKSDETAAEAA